MVFQETQYRHGFKTRDKIKSAFRAGEINMKRKNLRIRRNNSLEKIDAYFKKHHGP